MQKLVQISLLTQASYLNLTVESGLDANDSQVTSYAGTIEANSATSMMIDAQGKLDNATIEASSLESLELTSKSNSSLLLNTDSLVSLNVVSSQWF